MPLPMIVPTTIAVACQTPSTRGRSAGSDGFLARWASRSESLSERVVLLQLYRERIFYCHANGTGKRGKRFRNQVL